MGSIEYKQEVHVWSVCVGEHIRCFGVGLFYLFFRLVKYHYTKTTHVFSQDWSNTHLFLF